MATRTLPPGGYLAADGVLDILDELFMHGFELEIHTSLYGSMSTAGDRGAIHPRKTTPHKIVQGGVGCA